MSVEDVLCLLRLDLAAGRANLSLLNWESKFRIAAAVSVQKHQGLFKILHQTVAAKRRKSARVKDKDDLRWYRMILLENGQRLRAGQ